MRWQSHHAKTQATQGCHVRVGGHLRICVSGGGLGGRSVGGGKGLWWALWLRRVRWRCRWSVGLRRRDWWWSSLR